MDFSDVKWWFGCSSNSTESEKEWDLLPLTPEFIYEEHAGYLSALKKALEEPKIRNIALSGRYGVGKSSILQELARSRKNTVVELSLSTLAPLADEGLDDAVPKQAKTTTNRIQQEIVKQLLYREKPTKTPGSRFRRIERFSFLRELALAGLASTGVALTGLLTGWTSSVKAELLPDVDIGPWSHSVVLAISICAILTIRWALYGRLQIRQLSAGAATVTLDDHAVSYFDQYLDEIVYFFEISKRNIVIFEDIDRFDDALIFETLLSLNTLLNAQRNDDDPIRFIYAIKDSIFDQSKINSDKRRANEQTVIGVKDPAQAEVVRANRTKFFDLVIPVVPFITHRSAKNLAWKTVEGIDSDVKPALTDLAARFVPDMRLIKNVRNEFIVFRDRIFSGAGEALELNKTELFAMMLYKCTHLEDFEAISIGRSKIDELYKAEREIVSKNILNLQKEVRELQRRLDTIQDVTTVSELLGQRLQKHIKHTTSSINQLPRNGRIWLAKKQFENDDIFKNSFWKNFTGISGDPILEWRMNNQAQSLRFPRSILKEVLENSLDPEGWDEESKEVLEKNIEELKENLDFLKKAHMSDLIDRSEFQITSGETTKSFRDYAREIFDGDGLAYQLIRNGYINRNFTLYTATYHGNRVSAAAQNFIMLHVERDLMDEHFELRSSDVRGVILELGEKSLADSALYNIAILDHLLINDVPAANTMIQSLVGFGERQQRFMQAYINSGAETKSFISRFAMFSGQVFNYLVDSLELSESERVELTSTALSGLNQSLKYTANKATRAYLAKNYSKFPIITSSSIDDQRAQRIAQLFADNKIRIAALKLVNQKMQKAFISLNCYEINRENLTIALNHNTDLTLERAKESGESIYRYLLQDIPAYLQAVEGFSSTISSPSQFISIIEDAFEEDDEYLSELIANASADCIVEDITEVSDKLWPHLAEHLRLSATFGNLKAYIHEIGEIDTHLVTLLVDADGILVHESIDEEERLDLAIKLLNVRNSKLSPLSVTKLLQSLELKQQIRIEDIAADSGQLYAFLLRAEIIADSTENYTYLANFDWPTRELFIKESRQFPEYMTPDLVADDLASLMRSELIPLEIKETVLRSAEQYAEKCDNRGLLELARFANYRHRTLAPDLVEKMALHEVPSEEIVSLLQPNLDSISYDQLARVLNALGENFSSLTTPGKEQPKFPNTERYKALLGKLKEHGQVVSNIRTSLGGGELRVYKRHSTN